jgi:hypothetical protein
MVGKLVLAVLAVTGDSLANSKTNRTSSSYVV